MAKDPAALFYIDTWLSSTAEMDSDARGWYLNLILHQFDKKDLPNDTEKLAVLAGVKFSEYERFKQVLEQVLSHKFKQNSSGRLENDYAKNILQSRELFKDKRSRSGNIGIIVKAAKEIKGFNAKHLQQLKSDLYEMDIEQVYKHKDKQVLEHLLKLYINKNENINEEDIIKRKKAFTENVKLKLSTEPEQRLIDFIDYWSEHSEDGKLMRFEKEVVFDVEKRMRTWKRNEDKFKGDKNHPSEIKIAYKDFKPLESLNT